MSHDDGANGLFALANARGLLELWRYQFIDDFSSGQRRIRPELLQPYGEAIDLGLRGELLDFSIREFQDSLLVATIDSLDGLRLARLERRSNMLTGAVTVAASELTVPQSGSIPERVTINANQRWLFTNSGEELQVYAIEGDFVRAHSQRRLEGMYSWQWLLGQNSLLVSTEHGVEQWVMANRGPEQGFVFTRIRSLSTREDWSDSTRLLPAQRSKSFVLQDGAELAWLNATAERISLQTSLPSLAGAVLAASLAPRDDALLIMGAERSWLYKIDNPYPEVSLSVLWSKVWYEDYSEPKYIWQSSSASDDFEPKLSLAPLSYGTLEIGFLRDADRGAAGDSSGDLHFLLHGASAAAQDQAGYRDDGGGADGDPRLCRWAVPGAFRREQPRRHSAADFDHAHRYRAHRLRLQLAASGLAL